MGQRPSQTPHQRRWTDVKQVLWRDVPPHTSPGKRKWGQLDATACLLERPKSRHGHRQTQARVWSTEIPIHCWWGGETVQPFQKPVWQCLNRAKGTLTAGFSNHALGTKPAHGVLERLVLTAETPTHTRCPSSRRTGKRWYIQTTQ